MIVSIAVVAALLQAGLANAGIKLPAQPSDKSTPVQQRLSLNGPGSVAVAWNTYEQLKQACVQYGTDQNLSHTKCSKQSATYPSSRTWANLVILSGLQPATKYYYRIGSTNTTVDWFMTGRAAGDKTAFTMATFADLGLYGQDGYTTKKRDQIPGTDPALNHTTIGRLAAMADNFEFIIHPGDFAYADDWIYDPSNYLDSKNAYSAIIETFYAQLAPISARKLYMVSPGNHEADCVEIPSNVSLCPKGQSNFSDFRNRFDGMMPTAFQLTGGNSSNSTAAAARRRAKSLAKPPFWYSFDYGMAHVVMIDTETDFANAPDQPGGSAGLNGGPFGAPNQQIDFLEADLSSVDRTVTPWVVVAGHRPWYTNGNSPCKPCQAAFEGILYKYGVDVAAFGHVHNMQRFLPIYNGTADPAGLKNPKAPIYTIIGGSGNIEGHSDITPKTTANAFAYNSNFGLGTLTFHNATHLEVNFYNSLDGTNLDSSMLYKAHDVPFVVQ